MLRVCHLKDHQMNCAVVQSQTSELFIRMASDDDCVTVIGNGFVDFVQRLVF